MWNPDRALKLIEKHGRTRKWLAEQCGIGYASLNYILNGRKPGRPVLKLMANALGTDEAELMPPETQDT